MLPSQPHVITASSDEFSTGHWAPTQLQLALEALHRDGVVVLQGAVEMDHVERLRDWMLPLSEELAKKREYFFQGVRNNFLQAPPMHVPELLFDDIYLNDLVLEIIEHYLGPKPALSYITSNVCMAGSGGMRQAVHKDTAFVHSLAPSLVTVQFLLTDFTPENGGTEFYLGTASTGTTKEQVWESKEAENPMGLIRPELLKEREKERKPGQVEAKMGSVVLRDLRTWHSGMPNTTSTNRLMLGVNYQSSWHPRSILLPLPLSSRPFLSSKPDRVTPLARWVEDEEWKEKCQLTGKGEWNGLRYGPGEEGEWRTLQEEVKREEKEIYVPVAVPAV